MAESERRADMNDLVTNLAVLTEKVEADIEVTGKIHDKLFGNGGTGLVTEVAVTKSSLKRAWWFIGVIGVGLIGGMVKVIFA